MKTARHAAAVRDPSERIGNFREVVAGYSEETAVAEANRCLRCKTKPCTAGCPVGVQIPAFIQEIANRNFEEAYRIIRATNALPAVCGRVCPQERQCEGNCVCGIKGEPVAIGALERFAADHHMAHAPTSAVEQTGRRVAVVGSGPAGLSCAGELAKRGYRVTVFEALHKAGGVLVYGIPAFRLPKEIVQREISELEAQGVQFVLNSVIGCTESVEELFEEGYEAVFLGTGAGLPKFMHIPGENARGVFSANEYLTRINLMKAYEENAETPVFRARKVLVVGGGNVAMDAARCARRLGAEVTVVYRRTEEELPARKEEIAHAKEEGVVFDFLLSPKEVLAENGDVCGLLCTRMQLGEPDPTGRRRPIPTDETVRLDADCIIPALGTSPNPLIARTTKGIAFKPHGEIVADEDGKTELDGVYAGGDAVTGAATVILAMGAGRTAARAIDAYLKNKE